MRMASAEIVKSLMRFSTVLATLVAGFALVFAASVNAAAGDKKVEIKKTEKIEKVVKIEKAEVDSKARFNRNAVFNRNEVFNRNVNFNRNNFNPFFRPFAINDEFFFADEFNAD